MDLTIEAIEQDLMNAEANAGRPVMAVHLKRAEIRATLMGAAYSGPIRMAIPDPEPEDDLEAEQVAYEEHVDEQNVAFDELDEEEDADDDFFAEAKRERKK